MYRLRAAGDGRAAVRLGGAGSILREVEAAADMLAKDFGIPAEVWSLTSINELQRDGKRVQRWNLLHPDEEPATGLYDPQARGQ
jgi:pyruvate dehydrogenase E1 component